MDDLLEMNDREEDTEALLNMGGPKTVQYILDNGQESSRHSPVYLKYFWKILLLIVAFYGLPSMQFVIFQIADPEVKCFFNFKCAHPAFGLFAFNNIMSNLGYLVAGAGFLLMIYLTKPTEDGLHGLHTDMSLYYSMGLTVIFAGVFSALYHVCPSKLNFQFDTTFMIIGSGLLFIVMYQKRHGSITTGAFKAYGFFAMFIFLDFLSLTQVSPAIFWVLASLVFAYISWAGSAHLYAQKRVAFTRDNLLSIAAKFCHPKLIADKPRFFCLVLANLLSWVIIIGSAIDGVISGVSRNFSTVTLGLMIINYLAYLFYYIAMKYKYKESVRWYVWFLVVIMIALWVLAMYFFEIAVTNKFLTYQESIELNKPCVLFNYFDYHDIWHFLSAFGLVCVMTLVYFLDFDLLQVPRSRIYVF